MKKRTIYILVVISICLLLANVAINLLVKKDPVSKDPEASIDLIDSLFNTTIAKFNLDSTWIASIPINSNQYDSLNNVYRIKLPADLHPKVILVELKKRFTDIPVKLISDEKVVNRETTLNILSNNMLKLQATFNVDNEAVRKHSELAFVITNFLEVDDLIISELFHSIIPFSVLLKPSGDGDSVVVNASNYKKTFSILIDDGIEDDNFKLEVGLSKTRLKESVRYITWSYPNAELYVINEKSKLFHSAVFNFINDEFKSRISNLYLLSDFISLPDSYDEAESLLEFYIESSVGKKGKVIFVSAQNFNMLSELLLEAKQKGTQYFSPSDIIKRNAQSNVSM